MIACAERLEVTALPGVPIVQPGDDVAALVRDALSRAKITLLDSDVIVVASKVVSRAEGRFVDLATVTPSANAIAVAREIDGDARVVELVLRESTQISRKAKGALVVRHRLGFVTANAGLDMSNALPASLEGEGPWAILLPESPDASAARIRDALGAANIGVIVSDSHGRPFRVGSVGAAIGVAGVPATWDQRGGVDLFGRTLEHTMTALADQIAAAADLVAGQAAEARGVVHVRGVSFSPSTSTARDLVRPPEGDLYA
jgi:coenzyme F420-0:L-glutamate ligase/coenzyme F420-1:gamma-L-glutamate ligase